MMDNLKWNDFAAGVKIFSECSECGGFFDWLEESAQSQYDGGILYGLTPYGSGSSARCYIMNGPKEYNGYVLKEFIPPRRMTDAEYARRNDGSGAFEIIDKERLTLNERELMEADFRRFINSADVAAEIDGEYSRQNLVMASRPKLYKTSLGYCLISPRTGRPLSEYLHYGESFDKRLETALKLFRCLLLDLGRYHKRRYINGDIKPENLLCFSTERGNMAVRNLDFGSCILFGELEKNVNDFLHSGGNMPERRQMLIKYSRNFFESTNFYYDTADIRRVLGVIADADIPEDKKFLSACGLDVLAAIKTFYVLLAGGGRGDIPSDMLAYLGRTFLYDKLLEEKVSCCMTDYCVYAMTADIFGMTKRSNIPTAEELSSIVGDIIDVLTRNNCSTPALLRKKALNEFNMMLEKRPITRFIGADENITDDQLIERILNDKTVK